MSAKRRAGSSRGSGSTRETVILGELGSQPARNPIAGDTKIESIDVYDAHFGDKGGGIYKTGSGEVGLYGYESLGVLSIGGGSATNAIDVFISMSFESKAKVGPGLGRVVQSSVGIGLDSSGLYLSHTEAEGTSLDLGPAGGETVSGTQTTSHVHPLDAITDATMNAFSSIVGPLADPSMFIDPFAG